MLKIGDSVRFNEGNEYHRSIVWTVESLGDDGRVDIVDKYPGWWTFFETTIDKVQKVSSPPTHIHDPNE